MKNKNDFRLVTVAITLFFCSTLGQAQTPFDVVEINHTVKDYAAWKKAFDADSTLQKANGMEVMVVGRGIENPNNVSIVFVLSDVQKAKAFAADPRLKDVMEKNGVISKPDIAYYKVVRFSPDPNGTQWMTITIKVKDFDAWLKVFDAEGAATRAADGLLDAAVTRGIDDPNLVHIVFNFKDLAKAKAALSSEERGKLMVASGVVGPPKVEFYANAQ